MHNSSGRALLVRTIAKVSLAVSASGRGLAGFEVNRRVTCLPSAAGIVSLSGKVNRIPVQWT